MCGWKREADTPTWSPTTTVCCEFKLSGRRGWPLVALRSWEPSPPVGVRVGFNNVPRKPSTSTDARDAPIESFSRKYSARRGLPERGSIHSADGGQGVDCAEDA